MSCANISDDEKPVTDIAAGDKCNAERKDKCFGGAECPEEGVCKAAVAKGGDCKSKDGDQAEQRNCGVGEYCKKGDNDAFTCEEISKIGDECTLNA